MNLSEQVKQDQAKFLREQEQRLARAAEFVQAKLKDALSNQGSPDHHAAKAQPPLKQSGKLVNSIKVKIKGDETIIYSDCDYIKYLEKSHPIFGLIDQWQPQIQQIIFGDK